MSSTLTRVLVLAGISVAIFFVTVFILIHVVPGPLTARDYMIIGCVATLFCLLVVFFLVIATLVKNPNTFFKRRKR